MGDNEAQSELIRELFAECECQNLRIWLLGGWGIDALLGRVTREHHDIDLAAEENSKEALREAIRQIGGEFAPKPMGWRFLRNEVRVDITFVSYTRDGTSVSDLKKDDPLVYPWPPGSFPAELNGRLLGIACRAISWEAQYVAKAGYKDAFPDIELRDKDALDLRAIHRHVPPAKRKELEEKWFGGIPREKVAIGPRPQKPKTCNL